MNKNSVYIKSIVIKKTIFLLLIITSLFAPSMSFSQKIVQKSSNDVLLLQMQKYSQFLNYVEKLYIDTVNPTAMVENAIINNLLQLDPHSAYIPKEDMASTNESFQGSFVGIGIEFGIVRDTLIVVNTIPGGPAFKAGLLPNDKILKADSTPLAGRKIYIKDVHSALKGPKGTIVNLVVQRKGVTDSLLFSIPRGVIPLHSLDLAFMPTKSTGYIKLNRFSATTYKEFKTALDSLTKIKQKETKLENLILDLRGNGGGFLEEAVSIAEELLSQGSLIVYTEGRSFPRKDYYNSKNGSFSNGNLYVLVDEFSASASEILAGAIQDWDRGTIIGRRTFGKGLVQNQIPLLDGSAVRLTISRYHTPSGRAIQNPYVKGNQKDYYKAHIDNITSSISHKDSLLDSTAKKINDTSLTKNSLQASLDSTKKYYSLKEKRILLGGGGIYPDYFIPRDTVNTYNEIFNNGVVFDCSYKIIERYRDSILTAHKSPESFIKDFKVNQTIYDLLEKSAKEKGFEINQSRLSHSKVNVELYIKALIGQRIYSEGVFYKITLQDDPMYEKALELIGKQKK